MADNRYLQDRQEALEALALQVIDRPIVELIEGFTRLPYCFTLQSCYGHFLCASGQDSSNLERLPPRYEGEVNYRIAYLALCLENSPRGRKLRDSLQVVSAFDQDYVQFGSADWFWERHCNSYVLQVEPVRHRTKDQVVVKHSEALYLERIRDLFFINLKELLMRHRRDYRLG